MSYRNILSIILFAVIASFYAGCQKDNSPEQHTLKTTGTTLEPPPQTTQDLKESNLSGSMMLASEKQESVKDNTFNTQDKRMIIRTGTMSIEVDKYDETEAKIKDIVKNFGGYLTNSTSKLNADGKKQGSITIRVTSEKFDGMIAELSKIGKVMNQNITGNDVTEEYMDADARLKTQRELESRLLKLLEEKTAKLTDVVEVEQKLANVREQIERTEGRMKYLKDQASYSTLTVSVYEPSMLVTSTGGGFFYELGEAVKKGLSGFTTVLAGLITVVIALLPLILIALIVIYFVLRYFKKRKAAKAQA